MAGRIREGRGRVHGCYTKRRVVGGAPCMACCWLWMDRGDLSDLSLSLSTIPAATRRHPCLPLDAHARHAQRVSAQQGWAREDATAPGWGTGWAERDRPMPIICWVGRRGRSALSRMARDRIVQSVLGWWVVHRNGSWRADGDAPADRSPAEEAPVRADLSVSHARRSLRARAHGLARPAGRSMRSATVVLVNDRSICRPAGVHASYPPRPASTCLLLHHTFTQQDYICGAVLVCVRTCLVPAVPMQPESTYFIFRASMRCLCKYNIMRAGLICFICIYPTSQVVAHHAYRLHPYTCFTTAIGCMLPPLSI